MVASTYHPNTQEAKAKGYSKFKANINYIARLASKNKREIMGLEDRLWKWEGNQGIGGGRRTGRREIKQDQYSICIHTNSSR